jgi:hypothetical protein
MTEEDWMACVDEDSLYGELACGFGERKIRLFTSACLARVWPFLPNNLSRLAVEEYTRFADGLVSKRAMLELLSNVEAETRDNMWIAPFRSWPYGWYCWCCEESDDAEERKWEVDGYVFRHVRDALKDAEGMAAKAALYAQSVAAAQVEARRQQAAREQEQRAQFALLQDLLGKPFRTTPNVNAEWLAWNRGVVRSLARAAYNNCVHPAGILDSVRLAILADALEEAGCSDIVILEHLRGPGPHIRGCRVLDRLLGKE